MSINHVPGLMFGLRNHTVSVPRRVYERVKFLFSSPLRLFDSIFMGQNIQMVKARVHKISILLCTASPYVHGKDLKNLLVFLIGVLSHDHMCVTSCKCVHKTDHIYELGLQMRKKMEILTMDVRGTQYIKGEIFGELSL